MTKKNDKKVLLILSVGVVIFFIAIGGIYFYPKLSNRNKLTNSPAITQEREQKDDNRFVDSGEEKALSIVKNLSEVKAWLNLFSGPGNTSPKTGGRPIIEIDSIKDKVYTVHVYESMKTHNATFNWYYVNVETGKIGRYPEN